jgi:hypothetical protein
MMNWENLLTQLPIVAVFVWFVLEMDRRNATYAAQRDAQWREFLQHQSKSIRECVETDCDDAGSCITAARCAR